jgi:hypothetical protein
VPAAPASHVAAAPGEARLERGIAAQRRLRLPAHVGGQEIVFAPSALLTPDFAAADVRRPTLGATAVLGDRRSLVTASLALVMLVAASGSFLLLARRIERGAQPRAS